MESADLTSWEAQALPRVVEEISFRGGTNRPWRDGQLCYPCHQGRSWAQAQRMYPVPTALTVIDMEKNREVLRKHTAVALRRAKLVRIADEAREQGGVLTQEDVGGGLLSCDERTVRRDIYHSLAAVSIDIRKPVGPSCRPVLAWPGGTSQMRDAQQHASSSDRDRHAGLADPSP